MVRMKVRVGLDPTVWQGSFNGLECSLHLQWLTLRMTERMGYKVLDASQFASESRGVLQFVQALRGGQGGTVAADGPRGPIYQYWRATR